MVPVCRVHFLPPDSIGLREHRWLGGRHISGLPAQSTATLSPYTGPLSRLPTRFVTDAGAVLRNTNSAQIGSDADTGSTVTAATQLFTILRPLKAALQHAARLRQHELALRHVRQPGLPSVITWRALSTLTKSARDRTGFHDKGFKFPAGSWNGLDVFDPMLQFAERL